MLTWGALAIELALATLLWYRPLRPWLIVLAILLHSFIDGLLLVGFFGPVMIIGLAVVRRRRLARPQIGCSERSPTAEQRHDRLTLPGTP